MYSDELGLQFQTGQAEKVLVHTIVLFNQKVKGEEVNHPGI